MYFKIISALSVLQIILLIGCKSFTKSDRQDDVLYVIPHHEHTTVARKFVTDYSMLFYYGDYNFILTDRRVFYHKKFSKVEKNEKTNYLIPPPISLKPSHIKEIKLANLQQFLTSSIIDSLALKISIVSNTDTIRNQAFNMLSNFLQSKNHVTYIIRNWTEEEQLALKEHIHSSENEQ